MKADNMSTKNQENETLVNVIKRNKLFVVGIVAIVLAAIVYSVFFHEKAELTEFSPKATAICVQTSGCTSNSCVNHKQYKYSSGGVRQCCTC